MAFPESPVAAAVFESIVIVVLFPITLGLTETKDVASAVPENEIGCDAEIQVKGKPLIVIVLPLPMAFIFKKHWTNTTLPIFV